MGRPKHLGTYPVGYLGSNSFGMADVLQEGYTDCITGVFICLYVCIPTPMDEPVNGAEVLGVPVLVSLHADRHQLPQDMVNGITILQNYCKISM